MQVRPFNLKDHKVIRDLNPEDMNMLISVSGMVTRSSNIIPDPRYASGRLMLHWPHDNPSVFHQSGTAVEACVLSLKASGETSVDHDVDKV